MARDDLKIDISEIFGGDLTEEQRGNADQQVAARGSGVEVSSTSSEAPSPDPLSAGVEERLREREAEMESRFREMLSQRERELEARARELEGRLHQAQTGEKVLPSEAPVVDFDAPIPPPFASSAPPAAASDAGEASPPEPELDPQQAAHLERIRRDFNYLLLYDQFRVILEQELREIVGEKKTRTMLERTFELAREKYPEVFRNANWDAEGNLLQDGALDSQRVVDNLQAIPPAQADGVLDAALAALLQMRLSAVEKGLGSGMRSLIRSRLTRWLQKKTEQARSEGKDLLPFTRLRNMIP